jgi:hypothetical protein
MELGYDTKIAYLLFSRWRKRLLRTLYHSNTLTRNQKWRKGMIMKSSMKLVFLLTQMELGYDMKIAHLLFSRWRNEIQNPTEVYSFCIQYCNKNTHQEAPSQWTKLEDVYRRKWQNSDQDNYWTSYSDKDKKHHVTKVKWTFKVR